MEIGAYIKHSTLINAWLSTHVTPFLPHVLISAISVRNNVTDANLLKLLLPAIDNVKKKVNKLGVKVSTTVSFSFVNDRDYVVKELLDSLSEKNAGSLFVSMDNTDVPVGLYSIKVVAGFVLIQYDSSSIDLMRYEISLDNNGEVHMDYGVIEAWVSKVEETEKVKEDNDHDVFFFFMICSWILMCINVFSQLVSETIL
ncbi:hypothetical protein CTI12_AA230660 [Artemisia annua]|uniref:Uncharacterized protein n=1 Tax=Artemisia annua TaxID=35608 RepID=A0A2U1NTT0_ARTAN|nr:hypothetical protein CTI12_AA230660 [Artemisia annua]